MRGSPRDVCLRCELTSVATIRCSDAVVVQGLSVRGLLIGVSEGRTGHPWNDGQTMRRSLGHGRTATLQQELSVVDDPGTFCVKRQEKRRMTHQLV